MKPIRMFPALTLALALVTALPSVKARQAAAPEAPAPPVAAELPVVKPEPPAPEDTIAFPGSERGNRNRNKRSRDAVLAQSDVYIEKPTRAIQVEVEKAARDARDAMGKMHQQLSKMRFGVDGPASMRLFVLPSDDSTSEDVGRIREELAIMDRILRKAWDGDSGRRMHGGPLRLSFGSVRFGSRSDLDAMYLAGSGAVFLLEVDFPLAEIATPPTAKEKGVKGGDDTWEKTRRELHGETEIESEEDTEEVTPYDAARVQKLREALVGALKQAGNLKCVKSGETVTLVVTGRGAKGSVTVTKRSGNYALDAQSAGNDVQVLTFDGEPKQNSTVMTIRAKKSDLDAVTAGQLSVEDFGHRVTVVTRRETGAVKP